MTAEQLERAVEELKSDPGIDFDKLFRLALKGGTKQRGSGLLGSLLRAKPPKPHLPTTIPIRLLRIMR
jgi:hypothetical protein